MDDVDLKALYGGPLSYKQFRKLFPAVRHYQAYDHLSRADRAASHRLGHRQRHAPGEFFYTHQLLPDVCFPTAAQTTEQAYSIYLTQFAEPETALESAPDKAAFSSAA
jgi:hypothetical protein